MKRLDSRLRVTTSALAYVEAKAKLAKFCRRHAINTNIVYVLPALIIYLLYVTWPIISVFRDGFYDWDGFSKNREFVGLGNYIELLTEDRLFHNAIKNNCVWFVVTIGVMLVFGFILAYILNGNLRLRNAYRTALFLPVACGAVAISLAWNNIYNPQIGLLNSTLRALGLDGLARVWLGDPKTALGAILVVAIWQGLGTWTVIYLAGLQSIPQEFFEAAMIDGANALQCMWHIAIPMVKGTTATLLITGAIGAVRAFELPYIMTRGGPYYASELAALRILDLAFMVHRTGYASAASVVLILIASVITYFQLRGYRSAPQGQ